MTLDSQRDQPKAKVFISCGQRPDEKPIVEQVATVLGELGFEPYIALEQHTLAGLKENIFKELEQSEYFLFIDFKREKMVRSGSGALDLMLRRNAEYRGSLFTNQELAIASYLDMDCIGFQEVGLRKEDGILRFIQLNLLPVTNRRDLPRLVREVVIKQRWNPAWKNALKLERNPEQSDDIGSLYRVYHVGVRNMHRSKPAINCTVNLEAAVDRLTGEEIQLDETVDIQWTGVKQASMVISPQTVRYFDGCVFYYSEPSRLRLFLVSGYGNQIARIESKFADKNDIELHFVVHSENYPPARAKLRIQYGQTMDDIHFSAV